MDWVLLEMGFHMVSLMRLQRKLERSSAFICL